MIDILMTATLRPAVVDQTLASIVDRIYKNDVYRCDLIINVDPVGEDVPQSVIVDIARSYFPRVICNLPDSPSFPLAAKWVWSKATTEYVINAEDDYEVVKDIDLDHMISILDQYPKLSSLRLDRGVGWEDPQPAMGPLSITRGEHRWYYQEDGFYLSNTWKRTFSLNTSLVRTEFLKQAIPFIRDGISPERILMWAKFIQRAWKGEKLDRLQKMLASWDYGIYAVPLAIRDIGRPWRAEHGFHKPKGNRGIKSTWVRKD